MYPRHIRSLWRECEDAKRTLSARTKANIACDYRGNAVRVEITRPQFQDMTKDLLDRTAFTTRQTQIRNPRFAQLWGLVTDECAAYYGAVFVQHCAKSGKLELLSQSGTVREALFKVTGQRL